MRNIKIYIIFAFFALMASSCIDDLTKHAEFRFPQLAVMEAPDLSATFLDDYIFDPKLGTVVENDTIPFEESEYDKYSYEWMFYLTPGGYDTVSNVISHKRILETKIELLPHSSSYFLLFRVTNKATGIKQMFNWSIGVLAKYGQGTLIAHTKDGTTTDIDLLMAKEYNASFTITDAEILHRGIFSKANNGAKIPDVINDISYATHGFYALAKNKALYKMNNISYALEKKNNSEYFFYTPNQYKMTKLLDYNGNYLHLINDGKLYWSTAGDKFSTLDENSYPYKFSNAFVTRFSTNTRFGLVPLIAHDENNNQFVGVKYDGGAVVEFAAPGLTDQWAFNPRALPNDLELIAGGRRDDYRLSILMKSKTTNTFSIYRLSSTTANKVFGEYIFDMVNCPDLDKATAFAFSEVSDEFYYAVGNELRVSILNSKTPTATVSYTLPAGENISHILMHIKVSGKTTWSENALGLPVSTSSLNNVLTVASYNGSEGFIRSLPIQYRGAGGIAAEKYVKTYGGFGKITAIGLRQ